MSAGAWVAQQRPDAAEQHPGSAARADLRVAAVVTVVSALAGAVLGLVWAWWSPPGPAAQILSDGRYIPDETEAFVAGDGRYLVLSAAAGVVAALAVWFARKANRGPVLLLGLAAGTLVGALLTDLVGRLAGGGSDTGKIYRLDGGGTAQVTRQLPLSVHAHGLLVVEPLVAVLVLGLLASFAAHDDLGRPDPQHEEYRAVRQRAVAGWPVAAGWRPEAPPAAPGWPDSVEPGDHPEYRRGDGDAPGALQQRDLPPQ